MERRAPLAPRVYVGLVAFSLAGSLLEKLTGLDPGAIKPIASLAVLFSGVAALMVPLTLALGLRRTILAVLTVLFVGALSEVVGLYTGYPFGRYVYTNVWQPVLALPGDKFFPVPLPFAWFLVAGGSYLFMEQKLAGGWAVVAGALLATLIDLLMEPVMVIQLGYWVWLDPGPLPGGAPLLNPAGWFVTSLIAGGVLSKFGAARCPERREPSIVLLGFAILVLGLAVIDAIPGR